MSAVIDALTAQVTASDNVINSATILVNGIAAQITAAVAAATAGGASASDLAPFQTLATQLQTDATTLSQAVVANTPATPTPAPAQAHKVAGS